MARHQQHHEIAVRAMSASRMAKSNTTINPAKLQKMKAAGSAAGAFAATIAKARVAYHANIVSTVLGAVRDPIERGIFADVGEKEIFVRIGSELEKFFRDAESSESLKLIAGEDGEGWLALYHGAYPLEVYIERLFKDALDNDDFADGVLALSAHEPREPGGSAASRAAECLAGDVADLFHRHAGRVAILEDNRRDWRPAQGRKAVG